MLNSRWRPYCTDTPQRNYQSTPESRQRVAAQSAKAQVELSKMLGIKVDKEIVELAKSARF